MANNNAMTRFKEIGFVAALAGLTFFCFALFNSAATPPAFWINATPWPSSPPPTPPSTNTYYVATNGTAGGTGSIGDPWDIYTVLSGNAGVTSNDTVWIRSGSYSNLAGFTNTVQGLKLYAHTNGFATHERVFIQGRTFELATDTEVRNLFLQGPDPDRVSEQTGSVPNDVEIRNGFKPTGPNVKIINCVVSDILGFGVGAGTDAYGLTVYGTHSMFNGWEAPDRGHGHNYYLQNRLDLMTLKHCSSFAAMNNNFQARSSEPTNCQNFHFDGFVSWQSARMTTNYTGGYEFEVGESFTSNVWVHQLLTFNNFVTNGTSLFGGDSGAANDALTITNSIIGTDLRLVEWTNSVFLSNTVFAHTRVLDMDQTYAPASAWNFDSNNWFSHEWGFGEFDYPGGSGGHSDFTNTTGLDINGTFTAGAPTGTNVFIHLNDYVTNSAFVSIYNWASNNNVVVDCTSFLSVDDTYQVRQFEDPYGPVCATGIFSGNISFPMTNLAIHTPLGHDAVAATGPGFARFVVEKTGVWDITDGLVLAMSPSTKLVSSYSDNSIRLYKQPSGGETNIGFNDLVWDYPGVSNWCGTSTGTVAVLFDQSGQGNHGTNTTAAQQPEIYTNNWVNAPTRAMRFDGTDDYIKVNQNSDFHLSQGSYSIATWAKNETDVAVIASPYQRLISWYDGTNNVQIGMGNSGAERRYYMVNRPSNGAAQVVSTGNVDTGFHHVVFTCSGGTGGTFKIYIDGVDRTGGTLGATVAVYTSDSTTLYLGQRGNGAYWNGHADDNLIYNRVLSTDEIAHIYNTSTDGHP